MWKGCFGKTEWPYKSPLAFGVLLDEQGPRGKWKEAKTWRFRCKEVPGKVYEIARVKAIELGRKYVFTGGVMPNMISVEEFFVKENGDLFKKPEPVKKPAFVNMALGI